MAKEGGVYFAGCINQTAFLYLQGAGKDVVMKKFREQIEIFLQNNVDLIIAEVSCYLYIRLSCRTMQSTPTFSLPQRSFVNYLPSI